jgi:chemotaxis protein CheX
MTARIEQIEELTRKAVPEVFQIMLSMELSVEATSSSSVVPAGEIIGWVGFTGQATGLVYLYSGLEFAKEITGRMLGIQTAEVDTDEMVNDAFGELSNMVVGHVKSRLCDAGMPCTLSIPSVVRGDRVRGEGPSHLGRRVIGFRSRQDRLLAEVWVKESKEQVS